MKTFAAFAAAAFATGCASVDVHKVPTPTQYTQWTDDLQRQADAIEGIRFYLPRPFVSVFESFPVRTDVFIADGEVSADGNYVLVHRFRRLAESGELDDAKGATGFSGEHLRVARRTVFKEGKMSEAAARAFSAARPHSASETPGGAAPSDPQKQIDDLRAQLKARDDELAKAKAGAKEADSQTGVARKKVTNDNAAFAYQPLRGNFDIVYLPDFEEQYAVKAKSGLGNVQVEVNMGQGWSLQGLDSLSDNSELTKRIYSLMDTAMELGKGAAQVALGLPPGAIAAAKPQSASETLAEGRAGTPVTLRFVLVHYAAKGIYPVMKPREMYAHTQIGQTSTRITVNLWDSKAATWLSGVAGAPAELHTTTLADPDQFSFTVPRYPYQYVSFNTFQYLAIEAVSPQLGFGSLYDKTGTAGDPGDRQKLDTTEFFKALFRKFFEDAPADSKTTSLPDDAAKDFADVANGGLSVIPGDPQYKFSVDGKPELKENKLSISLKAAKPDGSDTRVSDAHRKVLPKILGEALTARVEELTGATGVKMGTFLINGEDTAKWGK